MKRIFKQFTLSAGLFAVSLFSAFAQSDIQKGNELYRLYAYSRAIPFYEKAISKNDTMLETRMRLADCFLKINEIDKAEKYLSEVVQSNRSTPLHKYTYAQVLMTRGKYEEARKWLQEYVQLSPGDERGKEAITAIDKLSNFYSDSSFYSVKRLEINSANGDLCPVFYKDGIVFTSSRESADGKSKIQEWTDKPYFALYYARGQEANFGTPEAFAKNIQIKYNDGPACFSQTGSEMYLTRNNVEKGKAVKTADRTVRLKLVFAKLKDGNFIDEKNFKYNSNDYNCAHAFLSPDQQKLYFASDMPGGFGGMDIWMCKMEDSGEWGTPENMGSMVNTQGNELFPSISEDGTFYFTSNGRAGLGGLDIYSAKISNGKINKVQNMGYPVNTSDDDFALVYDNQKKVGYFSSNRLNKGGDDDLYMFKRAAVTVKGFVYDKATWEGIPMATVKISEDGVDQDVITTDAKGNFTASARPGKGYDFLASKENYKDNTVSIANIDPDKGGVEVRIPLEQVPHFDLKGSVFEEGSKQPIGNIKVTLTNQKTKEKKDTLTDADGKFHFLLESETDYTVSVKKENCGTNMVEKSTVGLKKSTTLYADMGLFCVGDIIKIDNIYYDLAKWNIRPDAAKELDKLLDILSKYPTMKIELRSHTDCRASYKYNDDLSQKRATSAVEYLTKKGIDKSRMVAKGYGEHVLVNKCECEGDRKVPCTEEEHQQNRRTEFKILAIE